MGRLSKSERGTDRQEQACGREAHQEQPQILQPPIKHTMPRISDVYRLNNAKMNTGQINSMIQIKEKKDKFIVT